MSLENTTAIASGSAFSIASSLGWILQMHVNGNEIEIMTVKIASTVIIGVIGGVAGMIGKDFYSWFKNKIKGT